MRPSIQTEVSPNIMRVEPPLVMMESKVKRI